MNINIRNLIVVAFFSLLFTLSIALVLSGNTTLVSAGDDSSIQVLETKRLVRNSTIKIMCIDGYKYLIVEGKNGIGGRHFDIVQMYKYTSSGNKAIPVSCR